MVNIGRLRQFHAAFASSLGCFATGVLYTWPSYTSELYISNSSTPLSAPITKTEVALLGSLPSLGAVFGTAIAGSILDKFGRKNGGIVITLPYVFAWAIIGLTSSINVILASRFLAGIATGGSNILSTLFVSEVSEDSIRGALASIGMVLACIGVLFSYLVGWFFTYETIIWTNATISVASVGLMMLLHESPVHLLRNGMHEKAKLSIARYRGQSVSSKVVLDELYRLEQNILAETDPKSVLDKTVLDKLEEDKLIHTSPQPVRKSKNTTLISSLKIILFSPSSRRAVLVVTTTMTTQIFMGMMLIQVYASTVFTETDPKRSELYTVLFAVVQWVGCVFSAVATDKAGRRFLQIGSSVLSAVCLAGLGYLLQYKVAPSWIPLMLFMVYCFVFMIGAGSIPYILLAEVFTPQVITLATMLIMEWTYFFNFFAIAVFPYIIQFLGVFGVFYGFSLISLFNAIISYIILPETAGLSNQEIQKAFLPKRRK